MAHWNDRIDGSKYRFSNKPFNVTYRNYNVAERSLCQPEKGQAIPMQTWKQNVCECVNIMCLL